MAKDRAPRYYKTGRHRKKSHYRDRFDELERLKGVEVLENGVSVGFRKKLNFSEGVAVTIATSEDADARQNNVNISGGIPSGFIFGFPMSYVSASSVDVGKAGTPSTMKDSTNTYVVSFNGAITVDITASGVGGLDTGTETPSTWYAVHVVADSLGVNPVSAVFSLSAISPTLPSGYDIFRRVGWVRNDVSSNFLKFFQRGLFSERDYTWIGDRGFLQVLVGGDSPTYVAVNLSTLVPSTAPVTTLTVAFNSANAYDILDFREQGSTTVNPITFVQAGTVTPGTSKLVSDIKVLAPVQVIEYRLVKGGGGQPDADLYVRGFLDLV